MLKGKAILASIACLCFHSIFSQTKITLTFKDYKIDQQAKVDSNVYKLLSTYKQSADSVMGKVIAFSIKGLYRKQPESELGNFMTDCMKEMAAKKFNMQVDAAFVNYSGIRSYIPKGEVTIGKMYELMPFDNLIVLQKVKGSVLLQFLTKVAEKGGWPASGIAMKITDKKASNVMVNGKPLDENATYTIANSDYIANGGSECEMLKGIPQINIGYLYRDALIEYVEQITKEGKPLDWKTEGRLTY